MSITGGDWRVAGTTQSRYIDARQPDGMVQEVAWCGQCEYGNNIDNARLLCDAPELLEALIAMNAQLEADGYMGTTYGPLRLAAENAIAKARGQV